MCAGCCFYCFDGRSEIMSVISIDIFCFSLLKLIFLAVKLPKIEYDLDTKEIKVDESEKTELNLKSLPIASTFVVFEG